MSIVMHELFHIVMHINNIVRVDILPSNGNIAQVVVKSVNTNIVIEEIFAYLITIMVLALTLYIIFKITKG